MNACCLAAYIEDAPVSSFQDSALNKLILDPLRLQYNDYFSCLQHAINHSEHESKYGKGQLFPLIDDVTWQQKST